LLRAGPGVVPGAGLPERVGKLDCGPGGAGYAVPVGQGAAGPARPPARGPAQGAVRGAGRAGGAAIHPGDTVRPVPDGGLRRLFPVKVPDTVRNRSWLGKLKAVRGVTGYPAVELMTLAETGTRALIGTVFGPPATGETEYARRLLHLLDDTMLVLADRGFDAAGFLAELAAAGAQFLV